MLNNNAKQIMQNANTLFIKVAQQRVKHAYYVLVSFDSAITQTNCVQYITLCDINERMFNDAIATLQAQYKATAVRDVTTDGTAKALAKSFKYAAQVNNM